MKRPNLQSFPEVQPRNAVSVPDHIAQAGVLGFGCRVWVQTLNPRPPWGLGSRNAPGFKTENEISCSRASGEGDRGGSGFKVGF